MLSLTPHGSFPPILVQKYVMRSFHETQSSPISVYMDVDVYVDVDVSKMYLH